MRVAPVLLGVCFALAELRVTTAPPSEAEEQVQADADPASARFLRPASAAAAAAAGAHPPRAPSRELLLRDPLPLPRGSTSALSPAAAAEASAYSSSSSSSLSLSGVGADRPRAASHGTIVDVCAAEVREVYAEPGRRGGPHRTVRGLTAYRSAYRSQRVHARLEETSRLTRTLAALTDLRAHWRRAKGILRSDSRIAAFMILDLLVDLMFSLLYLVEMSICLPLWDMQPSWLYVDRPWVIWVIAVSFSVFNLVSFLLRLALAQNALRDVFSVLGFIQLITIVPFIASFFIANGQYLYVPYFLRIFLVVSGIKGVVRLRISHTRDTSKSFSKERLAVLVASIIAILYTGMCTIHYCELRFQNPPKNYSVVDMLYFTTVTVSTVGYGDVSPSSMPGRLVIILWIIVAISVVPGLISRLVDTFSVSESRKYYSNGSAPFIVVVGIFDTFASVSNVLNEFLHSENQSDVQIVFLSRVSPPEHVQMTLKGSLYKSRVKLLSGCVLDDHDLVRCKMRFADACFIMCDTDAGDKREEDEHNLLRAWAVRENALATDIYAYTLMPETKVHLAKTTSTVCCIGDLNQILLGYNCVYEGSATLIFNLLSQSDPPARYDELWQAQYGDGAGNEIYNDALNVVFVGLPFNVLAALLYSEFQVVLIGLHVLCEKSRTRHVALNPGMHYKLRMSDECIYIAQGPSDIDDIRKVNQQEFDRIVDTWAQAEQAEALAMRQIDPRDDGDDHIFVSSNSAAPHGINTGPAVSVPVPDGAAVGQPDLSGQPYEKTLDCFFYRDPAQRVLADAVVENADHLCDHFLIITEGFDYFRLLSILRGYVIMKYHPVLFLANRLPTQSEWDALKMFPDVFFLHGNYRHPGDLLRAGLTQCAKVIITPLAATPLANFGDSTTITVSRLVQDIASSLRMYKFIIVELDKRENVKFLRPKAKSHKSRRTILRKIRKLDFRGHEQMADYQLLLHNHVYAPVFAAGRVIVPGMLDSVLFQTYRCPVVLKVIKLFCGLREYNDDDFCADNSLPKTVHLAQVPVPPRFHGKRFVDLMRHLILIGGAVPLALLRQRDKITLHNALPFVYTNPIPSTLVKSDDLVFVLKE